MREILKNIWSWSSFSEEKGYNFNGTIVLDGSTKILIDPVPMTKDEYSLLKSMAPFKAIYLTNKDHERVSYDLRKDFGIPILINEEDPPYLKERPDSTFCDEEKLACGIKVIHLKDQKSPGESAFYIQERNLLIVGDALIGNPPGSFNLLPDIKYKDVKLAKEGLKKLLPLSFDAVLVGDGESILSNAKKVVEKFLSSAVSQQD